MSDDMRGIVTFITTPPVKQSRSAGINNTLCFSFMNAMPTVRTSN